jgi:hypothetical protein
MSVKVASAQVNASGFTLLVLCHLGVSGFQVWLNHVRAHEGFDELADAAGANGGV